MRGTIRGYNSTTAVVEVEDAFTVIELKGGAVELGDVIVGDLQARGEIRVLHTRHGRMIEVSVQDCLCSQAQAFGVLINR